MKWWRKRRAGQSLEEAAFEGRVQTFGAYGRGTVSGSDLSPAGINETAETLFKMGRRDDALPLWQGLAEAGDFAGTANMVLECAADGHYNQALRWWRRLEEMDGGIAPHDPGLRLRTTGRASAAEGWWKVAAEKLHDDRSREYLGIALRERGQEAEAARWLLPAAHRGDAACARELAALALLELEREHDDKRREQLGVKAMAWTMKAAQGGDQQAITMLGQWRSDL